MNQIINIPVKELYPHPKNPRKNVGDVTELSDSIKAKGVMQNLTIIKGHYLSKEEYIQMAGAEGISKADAEMTWSPDDWTEEGYTVIIGHRRTAAAKLAGLKELPCIIREMTPQEQVETMLLENMQRTDLTVVEQAQGFQMMLDLGSTENEIAEKTGFSRTTVHRRLEMAKLDQDLLAKKEQDKSFQLSIADFDALSKIDDIEERNKILKDSWNSNSLKSSVLRALEAKKRKETEEKYGSWLKAKGAKKAPNSMNSYDYDVEEINRIDLSEEPEESSIDFKGADPTECYYKSQYGYIYIMRYDKERQEEEGQREKKKKELRDAYKDIVRRREGYIRTAVLSNMKPDDEQKLMSICIDVILGGGYKSVNYKEVAGVYFGLDRYQVTKKDKARILKLSDTHKLLLMAEAKIRDVENVKYYGNYNKDDMEDVILFYEALREFGYQLNEKDKSIVDGTCKDYVEVERE